MHVWGATNVSCPIELKWSLNSLNDTVTASSSPVCTLLILGVSPNTTTVHQSHYAKHPLQPCKSKSGAFKISLTALSAATQTLFRCTVQTNFRIHGLASLWNGEFQISTPSNNPKKTLSINKTTIQHNDTHCFFPNWLGGFLPEDYTQLSKAANLQLMVRSTLTSSFLDTHLQNHPIST